MGDSTSMQLHRRAHAPKGGRAVDFQSVEPKAGDRENSLPDMRLEHVRPEPKVVERDFLAYVRDKLPSEEEFARITHFATQPALRALDPADIRIPALELPTIDAQFMLTTENTQADDQAASNCCICPPCNLL